MAKYISKTAFVKGCQCPKQLYYYKNNYAQRDRLTDEQVVLFERGINVGIIAQGLFPHGVDLTPNSTAQYRQAAAITNYYIGQDAAVLYEASFWAKGLYVIMDIVVNNNGSLSLYEVKNTRSVKPQHILDAAFQYYVISSTGYTIDSIAIVYPTVNLETISTDDYLAHFNIEDITQSVIALQTEIETKATYFIDMIGKPQSPEVAPDSKCLKPYPCDFMGLCYANVPASDLIELQAQLPELNEILLAKKLPYATGA